MTENTVVRGQVGIVAKGQTPNKIQAPGLKPLAHFLACLFLFSGLWPVKSGLLYAQTETATISGLVTDESGAVMSAAEVKLQSVERGTTQSTTTNNAGIYVFASVPPGQYQIRVDRAGFKQVDFLGLVVNVQDHIEQNFRLQVGSVSESVTVEAGGLNINTTDASVSTVIDRQFVENIPLNGRSFQSLISLTPGVLLVGSNGVGVSGEFSVNGQRTEGNYFTVDGVGANMGSNPVMINASGTGGNVASESALGTTQTMISLDALQEFRATTSTYSAEYGRTPGGQFSFLSRSGTNDWHGAAFDYFRNEALDANNWFNDAAGIPKTPERQNDFGGTLGGPVSVPRLYDGKDKTFFFFSYEGLRLQQPAGATTDEYPDLNLRKDAPAPLQPFLNSFPIPNGSEVLDANGSPIGLAYYTSAYSNPSSLEALSVRVDHSFTENMKLFARYGSTSSSTTQRFSGLGGNLADSQINSVDTKSITIGTTNLLSPQLSNDFRFNYARNKGEVDYELDTFGGARPFNLGAVPGFGGGSAPKFYEVSFYLLFGQEPEAVAGRRQAAQQQWNVTDAFALNHNSHSLKFGVDVRRLSTFLYNRQLGEDAFFYSENTVLQNAADFSDAYSDSFVPPEPIYLNFSAYAQDEWKVTPKLSLSLGLRWDVNPAPGNGTGAPPFTVDQIQNLNTSTLAPEGTSLWQTDYRAFAPRIGVAYAFQRSASWETVVRGGYGIFYDTGNTQGSEGFFGIGFGSDVPYSGLAFPLSAAQLQGLPAPSTASPYDNTVYAFDPHLRLPYTMQWNVAVQQAVGTNQALTVSYVGAEGRRLLFTSVLYPPTNPNFAADYGLQLTTSKSSSNYQALQLQFQRRLSHGLQALAAYTYSHSIDDGSNNFFTDQLVRASSDFDVRHNFQAGITYNIPGGYAKGFVGLLVSGWGLDARISARSGLPIDVVEGRTVLPNGNLINLRPDLVPGAPLYLYEPQYPGGRIINFNAFTAPPPNTEGNSPRNLARDFNAVQADLAIRREFPMGEKLRLSLRAEAFNLFNHPNFSDVANSLSNGPYNPSSRTGFGVAQATLNNSLGGLNPLYQVGGPRSLQLMLRLTF
jgi:Carboxypeptidase regulatory-like domain/TonB dependent receptor